LPRQAALEVTRLVVVDRRPAGSRCPGGPRDKSSARRRGDSTCAEYVPKRVALTAEVQVRACSQSVCKAVGPVRRHLLLAAARLRRLAGPADGALDGNDSVHDGADPVDERQGLGHARPQYSSKVPQHWAETGGRGRTLADKCPLFRVKFSNVDSI
jgi:hypothetical protein